MKNYQKFAAKYASEVILPPPPGEEESFEEDFSIPVDEEAPRIQSQFPPGFLEHLKDRMIMYESHHPNAETVVPGEESEERQYDTPVPAWKKKQQEEEVSIPASDKLPQDLMKMMSSSSERMSNDALVKLCSLYYKLANT